MRSPARRFNLGAKLSIMGILLLSLAFLVSTFLSVRATRSALLETIQNELKAQAESKAEIIRTNLIWTRGVAMDLASAAETEAYDEEALLRLIRNTLNRNEQVFGSTIAYEPYRFAPELYYWAPYYSRAGGDLAFTQLGVPEYDYFNKDWYVLPKEAKKALLSPPYFDLGGGNIWMVTWSVPFFDETGNVKGVATSDIAFSQFQEIVSGIEVGKKGYAFLLDGKGSILGISKNAGGYYEIMADNMLTSVHSAKARNWDALVNEMLASRAGLLEATDPQGVTVIAAYTPIGLETGWSLALAFPKTELLEKASATQNTLILYSILTVLVFGLFLYALTGSVTQPLRRLTERVSRFSSESQEVTGSRLAERIEISTRDELEDLAEAFNQMSKNLARAFESLEEKVAERSRNLERRSLELETIAEVGREIAVIHDLDTLLNAAASLIRERFNYYHVGVFLMDERGEFAALRGASSEAAAKMLEQGHRLKVGEEGLVGGVARTGRAHIALDVGTNATHFENPLLPLTRSEIALPLRSRGATIGVLDIQAETEAAFGEQDIKALQLLADQLAAAIENAELVQKVEAAYAELNKAYRLQTQSVWQSAIRQYQGSAYEYDGIQVRPVPQELPQRLFEQLKSGKPVQYTEEEKEREGGKSVLLAPIMVLNQLVGVIGLEQTDPRHDWTDEEIAVAGAAATRAAIALENARLLEESQRRALKEQTIFNATERVGSASSVENILRAAAEEIERVLGSSEVILQFNNDNASSTNQE
ncbi:MAG: GAF domain-containing protein [Chloroflexi bacterium]|nr:GAF domain-containing protein [Chloroflexota bacterium]